MATGELAKIVGRVTGWNAFALEDDVVYHTYSRTAPDRFLLAPYYYQPLDQIPADATATSRCAATTSTNARAKQIRRP